MAVSDDDQRGGGGGWSVSKPSESCTIVGLCGNCAKGVRLEFAGRRRIRVTFVQPHVIVRCAFIMTEWQSVRRSTTHEGVGAVLLCMHVFNDKVVSEKVCHDGSPLCPH
eukprot:jgi/Botrbrau1/16273/Bobra.0066s0054.1